VMNLFKYITLNLELNHKVRLTTVSVVEQHISWSKTYSLVGTCGSCHAAQANTKRLLCKRIA